MGAKYMITFTFDNGDRKTMTVFREAYAQITREITGNEKWFGTNDPTQDELVNLDKVNHVEIKEVVPPPPIQRPEEIEF